MFTIACSRPLKALRKSNGEVVILDRASLEAYQKNGGLRDGAFKSDRRLMLYKEYGNAQIFDVPCGRCVNCRLAYARKWSERCLLEASLYEHNWFVTLTYDDEHLPSNGIIVDGLSLSTLVPEDVTLFLKRLRETMSRIYGVKDIRYYMCGEYGDHSMRSHYHVIAFNLPLYDLKVYSKSPLGDYYYNSDLLTSLWGKGHVVIGEVSEQSISYVARYCQKKATKEIDYDSLNIHKEYIRMSRRPGIGVPYLEKHLNDVYSTDQIYLPNGKISTPCRTFDNFALKQGIDLEDIKQARIDRAISSSNIKAEMVSRDFYEYLDDLELEQAKRYKALTRYL